MRESALWMRRAAMLPLLVGIAACGGGGGGSASTSSTGGMADTSTGLVPTAQPLGATLQADATLLRPLVPNAVWTYRGTDTASGSTTVYTDVVTQTATTGGVVESSTNAANDGADTGTLAVSGGSVTATSSLTITTTEPARTVTYTELRSPVRQNDQTTLVDTHVADVGADVDGDGKNDAGDLAIYSVVIGADDLALENLPALHTVRVDTIALVRYTLSSTGKTTDTIQATTVSTWYAAGIGVVRQRSVSPTADGPDRNIDETLLSWDASTQGYGALAPVTATFPASSPSAGTALPGRNAGFVRAFVVGDHALAFTQTVDPATSVPATQVSRLDKRGTVVDSRTYAGLSVTASSLVALSDGALALTPVGASTSSFTVTRWDATGQLVGTAQGTSINLRATVGEADVAHLALAADASTLWAAWTRVQSDPSASSTELVVRSFDLGGQALTPELVVGTVPVSARPSLDVEAGRVLVAWATPPGSGASVDAYAVIEQNALTVGPTTVGNFNARSMTPFLFDSGGAFVLASESFDEWSGMQLGADLTPLPLGSLLQNEVLSEAPPAGDDNDVLLPLRSGNLLSLVSFQSRLLFSTGSGAEPVDTVTWVIDDGGTLTKAARYAVSSSSLTSTGPYAQLSWPDRTLLIEGDLSMATKIVWLNAGSTN